MNKPRALPAFQDSRLGGGAGALVPLIIKAAAAGGAQFLRLGLGHCSLINLLDREASGIILLAKTAEARADLKNQMGSMAFSFRYHFLAETAGVDSEQLSCDLPLAIHHTKPLALISHKTGKKAETKFRRLQDFGALALWESESPYDRFHQVRVHAVEVGLRMVGEGLYRAPGRGESSPPSPELCLHLARLQFRLGGEDQEVTAPYPVAFDNLLRRLHPGAF